MADGAGTVGGAGGDSGGAGGTVSSPNGVAGTDGGGGGGGGPSGTGGAGGADSNGQGGGGTGGNGGTTGYTAVSLPATASQGTNGGAGGNGGQADDFGAGGGGGGAGGYGATANATGTLSVNVTGGNGNSGGAGGSEVYGGGSGGGGGGGGGGLLFDGTTLTLGGGVTAKGGAGGVGGQGGQTFEGDEPGNGGNGGDGGDGIDFTDVTPNTLVNQGTITGGSGGAGGAGGTSDARGNAPGSPGQAGIDGAGVAGENLTITNTGTISGGGTGDAIDFTGGSNTLTPGTGTLNGNIGIDGGAATTLTIKTTGAVTVTLANAITGTGSLTVSVASGSTLTLSGTNTYSGTTTVSAGTLDIQNDSALGTSDGGTTVKNGATLKVKGGVDVTETLTLNGMGVGNAGALEASGTVFVQGIVLGSASRINSDATEINIQGNITGTGMNLTFGGGAVDYIPGAIQTGTGSLTIDGNTHVNLSGTDTYTGTTTVSSGLLILNNGKAIADAGAVVIDGSGTLIVAVLETIGSISGSGSIELDDTTLTTGGGNNTAPTTFSGVISDYSPNGSLAKIGTGTQILSGVNTYTGTTTVSGGTLDIQNDNALGTTDGGTTVDKGATLKIDGDGLTINEPLTLNGGTLDGHDTSTSGNALTGSLNLTAASQISSDAGALTIFVNITGTGKGLTLAGAGFTVINAAIQTGTGTLTKIGTGFTELEGNDTYTGLTKVAAGILELSGDNQEIDGGAVEVDTGAKLEVDDYETVGSIVGGGSIVLYQSTLTTGGGSTPTTFSGVISDDGVSLGSLTKIGTGTQILSGANTYGGTTTVSAGSLDIQNNKALGTTAGGTTVDKGATLKIDGDGLTIAEPLTLAGGTLEANDTIFSGNTLTGTVTLTAGSSINSDAGEGGFTVQGTIKGSGQALTVGGAGFMAFGGAIQTGTGTLTKTGSGTTSLDGTDTYTGLTTVAAGTLYLEDGHAIADTGAVMVDAHATVDVFTSETVGSIAGSGTFALSGGTLTISGAVTPTIFSGLIEDYSSSAAGSLTKIGTGTQILSGANTYTGATIVSAGTLDIQNNKALGTTAGGTTVDKGATLKIDGDGLTISEPLTLAGGRLDGHDPNDNGNTLSGAVTLTAASEIDSDVGSLILSGTLTGIGQNLILGGADQVVISGGIKTGAGTLTKVGAGRALLRATNTYTGLTTVAAGTLELLGGQSIADKSAVVIDAHATLDLFNSETVGSIAGGGLVGIQGGTTLTTGGAGTSTTLSGVLQDFLSSGGGLTKIGAGTLTLSGANTYTGATTVSAGTLALTGSGSLATSAVILAANTTFNIAGVTSATSVANLTGAGATSVVSLGGKHLTLLKASSGTKVEYLGKTGTASSLVIDVASASFSLASATFKSWTAGKDTITIDGNASANIITGSSQNDMINGGGGDDTLTGGGGHDIFAFTTALNAATNVDTITDFTMMGTSSDTIELAHALFAAAGSTGTLASSAFHIGTAATAADQRIIYNSTTGGLFYDPDGNGAKAQVEFAKLAPHLTTLSSTDFKIV